MKSREEQIEIRKEQIPKKYKAIYNKAIQHKSRVAAVKAQCLECVGWQRVEVQLCTDLACPLYLYRPYS